MSIRHIAHACGFNESRIVLHHEVVAHGQILHRLAPRSPVVCVTGNEDLAAVADEAGTPTVMSRGEAMPTSTP